MSMSNRDRAARTVWEASRGAGEPLSAIASDYIAAALADAGLLTLAPQVIRTVGELEALDPGTMVWPARYYGPYTVGTLAPDPFNPYWTPPLPAVVVATAEQVRAARKAREEA